MAIEDFYISLSYIPKIQALNARKEPVTSDSTPVTFQGLINQASSNERLMAEQLGIQADFKMYYPVSVTLPNGAVISDGTDRYRIVSEPKNTVNRNHHYKVLLQWIERETL